MNRCVGNIAIYPCAVSSSKNTLISFNSNTYSIIADYVDHSLSDLEPIQMETFFTPYVIFMLAGFGFIAIVALHLLILLLYKISKNKEFHQQQQNPSSECNVSARGVNAVNSSVLNNGECNNLSSSRETLGSHQTVGHNKFGTIKSTVTVHNVNEPPKTALNTKLEKLEYPRGDVVYVRSLGQGAFGRVFQVSILLVLFFIKKKKNTT